MGFEQADTPSLKFEKLKAALSQAVDPTQEGRFTVRRVIIDYGTRA